MTPLVLALCLGAWAAPVRDLAPEAQAEEPVAAASEPDAAPALPDEAGDTVAALNSAASDEEAFERLFGGDEPKASVVAPAAPFESSVPLGAWVGGLLALGGLFYLRQRVTKGVTAQRPLKVLGRVSLGREGSLTVVEVTGLDGRRSRLLVGAGGGAPRLVTDLGSAAVVVQAEEEPVELSEPRPERPSRAKAGAWARALRMAGADVPSDGDAMKARLADRGELVAEVLAERRSAKHRSSNARNPLKRRGLVA